MNNFAALFAFNAAFQSSQVFRLKTTAKVSHMTPGGVGMMSHDVIATGVHAQEEANIGRHSPNSVG